MRFALVLLALLALPARGQVITCVGGSAGQGYNTCPTLSQSTAPAAADLVLWCPTGSPTGQPEAACAAPQWLPWSNRQSYSQILTTYAGWQQASAITFTQTAAVSPPPCLPRVNWPPKAVYGTVPTSVSTRADTYAVWVCELPTGYVTVAWLFNVSEIGSAALKYAAGKFAKAQADASCASTCWVPNAAEQAFLDQLVKANTPGSVVAFNGANGTRSVFKANADGTLNPIPVSGSSIAVATPCNPWKRIPGTPYYDVTGAADASRAGQTLQGVYAVCIVSLPIGSN
jgi:hypothetical protein